MPARAALILGIVAFLAGLVVAGTAPAMVQLALARGVQGIGVGSRSPRRTW